MNLGGDLTQGQIVWLPWLQELQILAICFCESSKKFDSDHDDDDLVTLNVFKDLPAEGVLFPYLSSVRANDRATEFRSRCRQLGIESVTLHSYRYAWAERAKVAGYPERFAQEALGHNSKAVHRAYAKRALMKLPSLEDHERQATSKTEIAT